MSKLLLTFLYQDMKESGCLVNWRVKELSTRLKVDAWRLFGRIILQEFFSMKSVNRISFEFRKSCNAFPVLILLFSWFLVLSSFAELLISTICCCKKRRNCWQQLGWAESGWKCHRGHTGHLQITCVLTQIDKLWECLPINLPGKVDGDNSP